MRRGAESMPTIQRVEAEVEKINSSGILPPGVQHRAHLRPQRPDQHHDAHRAAQHGRGHRADLPAAVGIPRQSAQRHHRGHDHPVRAVLRHRAHGAARRIGESAVGRGHRFRAGRRCHRDHGGEHLPAPGGGIRTSGHRAQSAAPDACAAAASAGKMGTISIAAAEVSQSIFFAAAIIIAGFVPLFTLSGIEGHIFGPMAKTYAYAIAGGLIATFTIAPALSLLLFPQEVSERETAGGPRAAPRLPARSGIRAREPHRHLRRHRAARAAAPFSRCARWASSFCPSSRRAICGSARPSPIGVAGGQRRLRQSHARIDEQVSRGAIRRLAARTAG